MHTDWSEYFLSQYFKRKCSLFCSDTDFVQLRRLPESFCYSNCIDCNKTVFCNRNARFCEEKGVSQPYCFKATNKSSTFALNVSFHTPTNLDSPHLFVRLGKANSNSWVDIQVRVQNTMTRKPSFAAIKGINGRDTFLFFTPMDNRDLVAILRYISPNKQTSTSMRMRISSLVMPYSSYFYERYDSSSSRRIYEFFQESHMSLDLTTEMEFKDNFIIPLIVQGTVDNINLSFVKMQEENHHIWRNRLEITWLENIFWQWQAYMTKQPSDGSSEYDVFTNPHFQYYLNFSCTLLNQTTYYLFVREPKNYKYDTSGRRYLPGYYLKSWNKASGLCSSFSASLPIILSRQELGQIQALIKLSPFIPPLESMFVGIKLNVRSSEVQG